VKWPLFSRWDIERAARPWGKRPSVLRFLETAPRDPESPRAPPHLPDEERFFKDGLKWVAGGMDGVGMHHMGQSEHKAPAQAIWTAFVDVTRDASDTTFARLYDMTMKEAVSPLADELLALAREQHGPNVARSRRLSRLVTRCRCSPGPGPLPPQSRARRGRDPLPTTTPP